MRRSLVSQTSVRERFYLKGLGESQKGEGGGEFERFLRRGVGVLLYIILKALHKHPGGEGGGPIGFYCHTKAPIKKRSPIDKKSESRIGLYYYTLE